MGSEKSFSAIYSQDIDRKWRAMLMPFFLRQIHDRNEAEDLTQETLARGISRADIADLNVRAYLFTIAANLLRDRARRARSHRSAAVASFSDPGFNSGDLPTEEFAPERVLIGRERLGRVLEALSELEERTHDIFVLFRLEKMRQKDIAALFGISVSAVEKHVVKAAVHLTVRLGEDD